MIFKTVVHFFSIKMHLMDHSFLNKENYFHTCVILDLGRGKLFVLHSLHYSAFHTKDVKNEPLSKTQGKGKKKKDPSMGKQYSCKTW